MSIYYVDGQFVPAEEASVPVGDLAVLRGYGAFDFLRTYNGRPFRLAQNLARLRRSADLIGLEYPWSDEEVAAIVQETLERNNYPESTVRILVTGGLSADNITPEGRSRLIVIVTALKPMPDWWYSQGIKVVTVDTSRLVPNAKSTNYLSAILAMREARAAGAVEALYLTRDGLVLEGTTSNLFIIRDGEIITPADSILPGITRQTVLELVEGVYPVSIREITRDELLAADEAFLTSANKQVAPVVQVDDIRIGAGVPGEHTRRMMDLFHAEIERVSSLPFLVMK